MNTVQTLIGIDYGLKRIGVAIGNIMTNLGWLWWLA